MNLFKSLFLGSAAGLVAVAGAQAADLPMAEPVEYVKICDTYGSGYFYLPGTETCLKVGGHVRVEAIYVEPKQNDQSKMDFHTRARASFDARTATEYGLLRSFVRLQFDRDTGTRNGGPFDYAYIQFAGLTAGYTDSMFDFKPYPSYAGMLVSDIQTIMFAYTAQFGDGFSATLSAEDSSYRSYDQGFAKRFGTSGPYNTDGGGGFTQTMPDFVANVRVEQGWGEAQLSAAVHQIDPANNGNGNNFEYGWAVQGGVQINLPMIAEDDFVYVSGAYADGALSYLLSGYGVGRGGNNDLFGGAYLGDFALTGNGNVRTTTGFNVNGGFEHHWSPNWRSSISASYADIDVPGFVRSSPVAGGRGRNQDWAMVQVAGQTVWTPVSNLDIGMEVVYSRFTEQPGRNTFATPDNWSGRVRVERTF
jgi:hypothetical protein